MEMKVITAVRKDTEQNRAVPDTHGEQRAEVRLTEYRSHDRHENVLDERGDQRAQRGSHDQADTDLDEVRFHGKILEFLEHLVVPSSSE